MSSEKTSFALGSDNRPAVRVAPDEKTVLAHELSVANEAVRAASAEAEHFWRTVSVSESSTSAERSAEAVLHAVIAAEFPLDGFWSVNRGHLNPTSSRTWVVTALDGGIHFARGRSGWTVSVALVDEYGARVGVIADILEGEWWTAVRGHGAALNDTRLLLPKRPSLQQVHVSTNIPLQSTPERISQLLYACQQVAYVQTGVATSRALAHLAAGRYDLVSFEADHIDRFGLEAGALLCREVGLKAEFLTRVDGSERFVAGHEQTVAAWTALTD